MRFTNESYLSDMVDAYLEAAAWATSEFDTDGYLIHETLENFDFSEGAIAQAKVDCAAFIKLAGDLLSNLDAARVGHDFWLTREHHGSGFWDRGLDSVGDELTKVAQSFSYGNLYLGDDELLYFM